MNAEMEQAIKNWGAWLLAEDLSEGTVAAYEWDVRHVARSLPDKAPGDYAAQDLVNYLAARRLAGVSDQARKRSVSAMKSFFLWARGKKSPARNLTSPRPKRRKQRSLTWEQAEKLMAVCDPSKATGLRNLALICLLLESGLRSAEVCRLRVEELDLAGCTLTVKVKGGNEAEAVFDPITASYLEAWLVARARHARPDCQTVFCSIKGITPGAALTRHGLVSVFKALGKKAGLDKGLSPHDFRRSCAVLKSLLGAPAQVLKIGGRWSNLRQVESYTANVPMAAFRTYSPVNRLVERGALAAPASHVNPPG